MDAKSKILKEIENSWAWEYEQDMEEIILELYEEGYKDNEIREMIIGFAENPPKSTKRLLDLEIFRKPLDDSTAI